MKILFAATRSWDDQGATSAILNEVTGSEPVHIVSAYETRGPEAYVAEWVRKRAKLRRTSLDHVKASKQFTSGPLSLDKVGTTLPERRNRRDDFMIKLGGYDLALVLYRPGRLSSPRPLEIARRAEAIGIKALVYELGKRGAWTQMDHIPPMEGNAQ